MGVLVGIGIPGVARATEPLATALNWVRLPGAEECSPPATIAQRVEERLGRSTLVSASQAQLTVEARIERNETSAPRWRAVIRLIDANNAVLGTREIPSDALSCPSMDASLALVIAVMIDPELPMRAPAPVARFPAQPPASRVVVLRERVFVPRVPLRERPWEFDVGLAGRGALGLVPGPVAGLGLFARVLPPWPIAFELGGSAWLDANASVAGRGGTLSPLLASVAACPEIRFARTLRLAGCAGIEGGLIRANGLNLDTSQEVSELLLFGTLRARFAWLPFRPLAIHAAVGASIAAVQPRFYYDDATDPARPTRQYFYQVPPVGFWLELGAAIHFSS
jgi:hypothetical protein